MELMSKVTTPFNAAKVAATRAAITDGSYDRAYMDEKLSIAVDRMIENPLAESPMERLCSTDEENR
jgi:hypothetical protein